MSSPIAGPLTQSVIKTGNEGACRVFFVKIPGFTGVSDCDAASIVHYIANPFGMDVVITEALINITALDAQDADMDIGLADDAAGTNSGVEICDSLVNSAVAVKRGLVAQDGIGVNAPVWKASGTDSYITSKQNADVDSADLAFTLNLRCIPLSDMS
jgi:hypothetical protein